jgi:predicted PurR-regulated permease PerM
MTGGQRLRFWLAGLFAFGLMLYLLRGVMLPFVAGMAIAYFLDPVADRMERLGLSRLTATAILTVGFFSVLIVAAVLLAPVIQTQLLDFAHRIPMVADSLMRRLAPLVTEISRHLSHDDVDRLRASASEYAGTAASWALQLVREVVTGSLAIVNLLSLMFITPIVTFYLLRDWDHMVAKVDSWLPRDHAATIRDQFREINRTLAGFMRGQATVCLAVGLLYSVALTAAGIDLGLMVGLLSGVLTFVPYLGHLFGLVTAVSIAVASSPDWSLPAMTAGIFVVGLAVEGNVLTPKLVGDQVGLHPVWILFSLLAGGALFGFVGVILGVPVAAAIGVLVRFALRRYLHSPLYSGNPM